MVMPTTENTTQSPGLILKLNILQKREDAINSIAIYYRSQGKKRSVKSKVIANVKILLLELRPVLIRIKEWNKINGGDINSFESLRLLVNSPDIDEVIKAFEVIDIILDKKNLTTWDNRKPIDTFNLESENKANHT